MTEDKQHLEIQLTQVIEQLCSIKAELMGTQVQVSSQELPKKKSVPSKQIISVYWAGCAGLADLAEQIGERADKIGTTTECNLKHRLSVLGKDRYASITLLPDNQMIALPGFERWVAQAIHIDRNSIDPEIDVKTRTIDIHLPSSVTRKVFDAALQRALAPWSLERRHPTVRRSSPYSVGVKRISSAREIYAGLDPRLDGNRLLTIVEEIVRGFREHGRIIQAFKR